MKIKLESSSYNFKMKEEEDSFKARIKDSLDLTSKSLNSMLA